MSFVKLCLPRSARTSAAALVTAVSVLGVAGCSVFSPATVLKPYQPSDGTGTSVAGVSVRNVLVVSSGVDQPGVVSLVLVNGTEADASVEVSVDVDAGGAPAQTFDVPTGRTFQIGDASAVTEQAEASVDGKSTTAPLVGWVQIPQVPAVPGETVPMTFTVGGESVQVNAPVVLPCNEYSAITPTAAPGATATASAAPVDCEPATGEDEGGEADEEG